MTDLSNPPATKLVYDGDWHHANGAGMYEYRRSTSTNQSAVATVSYTFTGSGLDIIGSGEGDARLDAYVDGEIVEPNARTQRSGQFQQPYTLRGLEFGEHTVTLEVTSGEVTIDAVGVISTPAEEPVAPDALETELAKAEEIERSEDFTDPAWSALQNAISSARAAVADPAGYGLDGEGAQALIERLRAGSAPLWSQITDIEAVHVATWVGTEPELPETVTATLVDDSTREIPVEWDVSDLDLTDPWSSQEVPAVYGSADLSGYVEVVPEGAVAFADINGTAEGDLKRLSPAYEAIAELVGEDLLNEDADQAFDGTWGHFGRNSAGNDEVHYKGIESGKYNKLTTTGIYTANPKGSELGYTVTLPAGEYTLTAGSHSWWADYSRTADVVLTYDGEDHVVDTVTLDRSSPNQVLSYPVTLESDGELTFTLRNTSDESPMLSWVGVAEVSEEVSLVGIEVASLPDKTTYTEGEELDLAGLEITAAYSDGSRETLDTGDVTVTGYDPTTVGEQTLTVTYESGEDTHTATFTIVVEAEDNDDGGENGDDGNGDSDDNGNDGSGDDDSNGDDGNGDDDSKDPDGNTDGDNGTGNEDGDDEPAAGDNGDEDPSTSDDPDDIPNTGANIGTLALLATLIAAAGAAPRIRDRATR